MSQILDGFSLFATYQNVIAIVVGMAIGMVIGAIPGLSSSMGIALALPFTYGMNPIAAILLVVGIYKGGMFAGSISAILIKTPGTPGNICTLLDGWPLAQKGQSRKALDIALYSSVCADIASNLALIAFAAAIASLALKFGPAEYFWLMAFSLTIVTSVSGSSLARGLVSAILGLLLATVGLDLIYGNARFTFGTLSLTGGISFVPLLIGLFAIPEVIDHYLKPAKPLAQGSRTGAPLSLAEFKRCVPTILRSSAIGVGIGAVPGVGSTAASFLSYSLARNRSKTPENFGKGEIEGVAAAESGNNAVAGATLIPLLSLGIPGDVVTAVMMGAFLIHGISIGPNLFQAQGDIVYGIFFGIMLSSVVMLVLGMLTLRLFARISDVPRQILIPSLLLFCVLGTYAIQNSMFDIIVMFCAGLLGWVMLRLDFPVPPFLIAFVLGPGLEDNLRRTVLVSHGDFTVFLASPISWLFAAATIGSIAYGLRGFRLRGRVAGASASGQDRNS